MPFRDWTAIDELAFGTFHLLGRDRVPYQQLCGNQPAKQGYRRDDSLFGVIVWRLFLPGPVVGLFWRGVSARAAIVSLVLGAAATIAWFIAKRLGLTSLHEFYIGMPVGLLTYIGVAMSSRK